MSKESERKRHLLVIAVKWKNEWEVTAPTVHPPSHCWNQESEQKNYR